MKKGLILLLLSVLLLFINSDNKKDDLTLFLEVNNILYDDIFPYFQYQNFSYQDYYDIEEIRNTLNCSHLMAINKFKYQDTHPAVMRNTYLILVNKQFYLEKRYQVHNLVNPSDYGAEIVNEDILLPQEVLLAYLQMISSLNLNNICLFSGYRTYEKQEVLYNYYQDDNYSAKPGHSEHHTGLAIDISRRDIGLTEHFANTKEYQILIKNCHKFGFILRYPKGKENETGYLYEPWHFRYVGIKHATYIMKNQYTLERYLFENFEI